ncbi:protein MAIN-LIKE 1-like isoform X2 [Papaver somniferum]|nr:protein MAIN-LIKE 1-like isoform X2 [Papaver somniferum]XP_026387472.1 protein MAIN-LIKE 1-like isoform X2 [Papaver somniferum]
MSTSRFNNRIKTKKKQKTVADDDYNLISTGQIKEIDVPGLGRFPAVEDDKPHASTEITVADNNNSQYTHRGNLHSIITHYKVISRLSPKVKYIIERAGWDRPLNMELGETPHSMVEYIVERFWDTTNTFHFPFGEMAFTPLDWVMLTGVNIGDGLDVPYDSEKYQFEYVSDNIFPDIQDASLCPKGASWKSNSITVKFLSSYFVPEKLRAAENDKAIAERVATSFFMYVLGQFFFSNAKNYIDAGWLAAFDDLDAVHTYDWGGAAFSRLYAALRIAGRKRKTLSGPFQVLEFWGYEYLGICPPEIVQPKDDQPISPRSSRWKPKKKMVDIVRCRTLLNKLTADQVT